MKPDPSLSRQRRHAREMAVKVLYEMDLGSLTREEGEGRIRRRLRRADTRDLAVELVGRALENLVTIDRVIGEAAENWDLSRMAAIDRSILRLGAAEILFSTVPAKVAINEAIEIAKRFSTEDSGRFVNGILDKVARTKGEVRDNI